VTLGDALDHTKGPVLLDPRMSGLHPKATEQRTLQQRLRCPFRLLVNTD
jgi:hypothetical protein